MAVAAAGACVMCQCRGLELPDRTRKKLRAPPAPATGEGGGGGGAVCRVDEVVEEEEGRYRRTGEEGRCHCTRLPLPPRRRGLMEPTARPTPLLLAVLPVVMPAVAAVAVAEEAAAAAAAAASVEALTACLAVLAVREATDDGDNANGDVPHTNVDTPNLPLCWQAGATTWPGCSGGTPLAPS